MFVSRYRKATGISTISVPGRDIDKLGGMRIFLVDVGSFRVEPDWVPTMFRALTGLTVHHLCHCREV